MSTSATATVDRGDLKSTSYEFFILARAILSIANLPTNTPSRPAAGSPV